MSTLTPPTDWKPFDLKTNNLKQGFYWWKLKNNNLPNLTLMFLARLRTRGAGLGPSILSPAFDYWDGYNVFIPKCEWAFATELTDNLIDYSHMHIEGLNLLPCPFCGKIPTIFGKVICDDGGMTCNADPQNYNMWRLGCCKWWSSNNWYKDPYILEADRMVAFYRTNLKNPDTINGGHCDPSLTCSVCGKEVSKGGRNYTFYEYYCDQLGTSAWVNNNFTLCKSCQHIVQIDFKKLIKKLSGRVNMKFKEIKIGYKSIIYFLCFALALIVIMMVDSFYK